MANISAKSRTLYANIKKNKIEIAERSNLLIDRSFFRDKSNYGFCTFISVKTF